MVVRSRSARREAQADPASAAALTGVQKALGFLRVAGVEIIAGILFTAISYLCGWAQYMAVAGVGPEAAFLACIAPFVVVDLIKIVAAVACARAVKAIV